MKFAHWFICTIVSFYFLTINVIITGYTRLRTYKLHLYFITHLKTNTFLMNFFIEINVVKLKKGRIKHKLGVEHLLHSYRRKIVL
jgi:hypothetical protein